MERLRKKATSVVLVSVTLAIVWWSDVPWALCDEKDEAGKETVEQSQQAQSDDREETLQELQEAQRKIFEDMGTAGIGLVEKKGDEKQEAQQQLQKAMQKAMEIGIKIRKKQREAILADPAWQPTHEEVAVIGNTPELRFGRISDFHLASDDRLLVCDEAAKEIKIVRTDGRLQATWKLDFPPQAIGLHPDGKTVFVGGNGHLAKLGPDGTVVKTVQSPAITDSVPERKMDDDGAGDEGDDKAAESGDGRKRKAKVDLSKTFLGALLRVIIGPIGRIGQGKEMAALLARRKKMVTSIAVTEEDVFVVCPARSGYAVWRMNHDLENPEKIVDRLRGCCGQMNVVAKDGQLWVPENGRHRVVRYDRDGEVLSKWGKRDRAAAEGFGGCCEPKNLCFGPNGEVYTSESGPPESVKRFTPEGEFLGVVALPDFQGGCVRVTVAANSDGSRIFVMNTGRGTIHAFAPKDARPPSQKAGTADSPADVDGEEANAE